MSTVGLLVQLHAWWQVASGLPGEELFPQAELGPVRLSVPQVIASWGGPNTALAMPFGHGLTGKKLVRRGLVSLSALYIITPAKRYWESLGSVISHTIIN